MWGLLLFVCKLGSRRQLDFDLRDLETHVLANVNRLAETCQKTLPVDGTLDHFMGHLGWAPPTVLRRNMIRRLIRMKVLDDARLLGRFVVAVDGSGWLVFRRRHCDRCLWQEHGDKIVYFHEVLEAKLLGPAGLALSAETEFIENTGTAAEGRIPAGDDAKQDCELKALARLAPSLRKSYPQTPICLTSDSLYGCGTAMGIARDNGFSFVFVFKEGRMPSAWEEFQRLVALSPENRVCVALPGGGTQIYNWVEGMSHVDAAGHQHDFNALQCVETIGGTATRYAWMTGLPVSEKTVVAIATKGGRARWKIENQGFNVQKNSDFNLEHPYSTDPERMKAYYCLLQVAHIILQLLEKGSLLRQIAEKAANTVSLLFGSLKNIARRLLEALRNCHISDDAFDPAVAARIQIRLDSS